MLSRRARSAAVVRLLTVPRGVPVRRAISLCERPWKYARVSTSRWGGESRERAEATSNLRERPIPQVAHPGTVDHTRVTVVELGERTLVPRLGHPSHQSLVRDIVHSEPSRRVTITNDSRSSARPREPETIDALLMNARNHQRGIRPVLVFRMIKRGQLMLR